MTASSPDEARRPRLFLVDAYAFIYRAYFAFAGRPLTNSRGENTSATFGFSKFLLDLRNEHAPDYAAVVFDSGRSHREELYPAYKATRKKMPEELRDSLPRIRDIAQAMGLALVEVEGWEADDVIGTLAKRAEAEGLDSVIVSGDKDFYQLVGARVKLLRPGRRRQGEGVASHWVGEEDVTEKLGVGPRQVVDYLALVGDASDNVPGAPGIGPKTAVRLLKAFDSVGDVLDGAAEGAGEVSPQRVRESLASRRSDVLLSRELVTIRTDVEVDAGLKDMRVARHDEARLRDLFVELEFTSLLGELASSTESGTGPEGQYALVAGARELENLVDACRRGGVAGIVVLTHTLDPARGPIAGVAVASEPGAAFYLPFGHAGLDLGEGSEDGANLGALDGPEMRLLRDLLADPAVVKVGHDLKRSMVACRRAGLELAGPLKDVMVASYLLNPGRRNHGLDALAEGLLGAKPVARSELLGTGRKRRDFGSLSPRAAVRFACERSDLPLRLWERFERQLADKALTALFDDLEMPLAPVLADMEAAGIAIDVAFFRKASKRLGRDLRLVRDDVFRVAGVEFNVNSTPQLRGVLFDRLGLPVMKRTKTGPSTDSSVLEELAVAGHELPRLLMDYRQLEKLRSTYVDALPSLVNPETGRIHTTFNQTVAATGRLSSSDPNLQNIPIRTAAGREIRRGFVARPGALLLTADYSQIELRILAHFSGDPVFVEAFKADKDIHRETAAILFEASAGEVTSEMRYRAKTVNFATLYGQGPFSLARGLGISLEEAKEFIAQYFDRFAGVRRFLDQEVEQAREKGYVETLMGRRRYVPELRAKSWNVRQFGERVARNTPIQGTAADLVKVAMLRLDRAFRGDEEVRMLLQVHDELVFEVEEGRVEDVAGKAVAAMESACELSVPLRVDAGSGRTWFDCKG